jgi:Tfp pilus assembly protein PilF
MRQPPRICKNVDLELPLVPCAGSLRTATVRPRPAPNPGGRFARKAVAGAILVAAAGCATHDANPTRQFRIEPVLRVSQSAQSAASSQAYFTLGRYFDNLHEWGRAVDAYRQAVAADTQNIEALNALGVVLAQERRFGEAEATLRHAVDLAPDRSHIRNNLGYVLLLEGRPQDAMSQLEVAVAKDGTSAIAQANLRDAMARSGARSGAAGAAVVALAAAGEKPAPAPAPTTSADAADAAANPVRAPDGDARTAPLADTPAPSVAAVSTIAPESAPPQRVGATAGAAAPTAAATVIATATAAPTSAPSPAPDAGAANVLQSSRLEVSNGNGMNGMAAHVGLWLAARGVPTQRLTNQQPYAQRQTVIQFRSGHEDAARRLASLLPASAQTASQASPDLRSDVRVVLGRDWVQMADCLARRSCQPVTTASAGTTTTATATATAAIVIAQR